MEEKPTKVIDIREMRKRQKELKKKAKSQKASSDSSSPFKQKLIVWVQFVLIFGIFAYLFKYCGGASV